MGEKSFVFQCKTLLIKILHAYPTVSYCVCLKHFLKIYILPVSCSVQSWLGSSGINSNYMLFLLRFSSCLRSTVHWASRWRHTNTLYANGLQMSIVDLLSALLIMLIIIDHIDHIDPPHHNISMIHPPHKAQWTLLLQYIRALCFSRMFIKS